MDTTELIGFCAMCLSGVKHVPQLYKIHTEDNVGSFSKHAILMAFIASVMWLYYGFKKNSQNLIIGSIGSILYEMYLLQKILKYEKNV
jgi:Ca2+/H+ antiporter